MAMATAKTLPWRINEMTGYDLRNVLLEMETAGSTAQEQEDVRVRALGSRR